MKGRITRVGLFLIALSIGFNVATLTAALAATETVTYYLKGTALPVAGMSTAPVSGPLDDFKALGDDDDPGRTLDDTDKGIAEDNKDKYQQWEVPADGLHIDGPSTFTIWIAAQGFDDEETVSAQIFLLDCPGTPCTQLASALKTDFLPGDGFAKITMTFPSVNHTFSTGRRLAVRIVYPQDFKGETPKIWLAYAATSYPASLTVTLPATTTTTTSTTTTIPAATTTSPPGGSTTTSSTTLPWGTTTTSTTSTTLPWGTTTTSSTTLPWGTTTTIASNETTTTRASGGQVSVTTTTLPASPDARPVSSATEKSSLVVAASSAGVAADLFNTNRRLSPQEGLEVSFLSAAEAIRSQFLASTGLGVLGGLLVVVGMRRKLEED